MSCDGGKLCFPESSLQSPVTILSPKGDCDHQDPSQCSACLPLGLPSVYAWNGTLYSDKRTEEGRRALSDEFGLRSNRLHSGPQWTMGLRSLTGRCWSGSRKYTRQPGEGQTAGIGMHPTLSGGNGTWWPAKFRAPSDQKRQAIKGGKRGREQPLRKYVKKFTIFYGFFATTGL